LDRLDYWRLCTDFTVVQAALIVCGIPPEDMQWSVERTTETQCPAGYVAIRTALANGLNSGRIKPSKVSFHCTDEGDETNHFDIQSTTIAIEEIDRFLKSMGVICDFFDRAMGNNGSEMGAVAPMPPKLNAALKAWSAVSSDATRLRGRSPKQALEQWLVENAAELGILNGDGRPNRTGIEEICKVANWKPSGGAPSTPALGKPASAPALPGRALIRLPVPPQAGFSSGPRRRDEGFSSNLDDEIPF